jgi:hypothetical protein
MDWLGLLCRNEFLGAVICVLHSSCRASVGMARGNTPPNIPPVGSRNCPHPVGLLMEMTSGLGVGAMAVQNSPARWAKSIRVPKESWKTSEIRRPMPGGVPFLGSFGAAASPTFYIQSLVQYFHRMRQQPVLRPLSSKECLASFAVASHDKACSRRCAPSSLNQATRPKLGRQVYRQSRSVACQRAGWQFEEAEVSPADAGCSSQGQMRGPGRLVEEGAGWEDGGSFFTRGRQGCWLVMALGASFQLIDCSPF